MRTIVRFKDGREDRDVGEDFQPSRGEKVKFMDIEEGFVVEDVVYEESEAQYGGMSDGVIVPTHKGLVMTRVVVLRKSGSRMRLM